MLNHPTTRILIRTGTGPSPLDPLVGYLRRMPHLHLDPGRTPGPGIENARAALTCGSTLTVAEAALLTDFVRAGNGWLHVADGPRPEPPTVFGVAPEPLLPETELRVLFEKRDHPLAAAARTGRTVTIDAEEDE